MTPSPGVLSPVASTGLRHLTTVHPRRLSCSVPPHCVPELFCPSSLCLTSIAVLSHLLLCKFGPAGAQAHASSQPVSASAFPRTAVHTLEHKLFTHTYSRAQAHIHARAHAHTHRHLHRRPPPNYMLFLRGSEITSDIYEGVIIVLQTKS